jgi:ABC-type dipeptide/oligopeptide/nickel transport systems, permease components
VSVAADSLAPGSPRLAGAAAELTHRGGEHRAVLGGGRPRRPLPHALQPHHPRSHPCAAPPSESHWLGTDSFGRDLFTRLVYAAGIDLQMAFFGVVGPFVIGTTIGLLSGNFGGRADTVLMRILDITVSFPYFVLVIAIVAVLQPGLMSYYISLTLVNWVSYARLVRSQVIVLKYADFVLAARTIGLGRTSGDDASSPPQCHRPRRGLRHDRCGADHRARLLPRIPGPRGCSRRRRNGAL